MELKSSEGGRGTTTSTYWHSAGRVQRRGGSPPPGVAWSRAPLSPELLLICPPTVPPKNHRHSQFGPHCPLRNCKTTIQSFPSSSKISPHPAFGRVFSRFAPGHFTFPKTTPTLVSSDGPGCLPTYLPTILYTFNSLHSVSSIRFAAGNSSFQPCLYRRSIRSVSTAILQQFQVVDAIIPMRSPMQH